MRPELTVQRLFDGGFEEVGCWELNSTRDLVHRLDLPKQAGVYAFAINGIVQYVGLASKSLSQRLSFYRRPGVSQRTNIRLNEVIRGHLDKGTVVQILTAHPSDHKWNGFTIKGAEGLEAGLIAEFDLPWNMRGAVRTMAKPANSEARKSGQAALSDLILEAVRNRPGMTELEIAKAIYGPAAVQQRVNSDCRLLVGRKLLERRGSGGRLDPYVYHARD